ncbi:MAG TPA: lysylphosphatidylglycerol synthase transmembrane domain-containing protein [Acidimicrobiales bacterium]|nr:lysylphosphatidylglycerol synthase transmembrane domain-containing protein [Acidimicrobiales bacterium]
MPLGFPAVPQRPALHPSMPAPPMGHGGDAGRTTAAPDDAGRRSGKWRWPKWLPHPKVLLVIGIVIAFGVLLYRIRGDLDTALHRIRPSGLVWLPAAFVAEGVSFFAYALVQRRLLVAGGAHLTRRAVVRLTVAATGISNLVPGGTAPSSGWLVTQYRRHGVPLPLALWAVIAGGFVAAISELLLCLIGAGIAGLLGPALFVGLLALLVGAAIAGVVVSHHLSAVRSWLERDRRMPGLRLARRVIRHAGEVAHFRATVSGGVTVYGLSIVNWVLDVTVLAIGFSVVDLPVPWRALLFAYTAAQVAGSLAPVPGGIGFVEGGMIGALTLAGTPTGDAVVATVVYRLVTTVGMAGIGGLALVVVHRRTPTPARLTGMAADLANRGAESPRRDDDAPPVSGSHEGVAPPEYE